MIGSITLLVCLSVLSDVVVTLLALPVPGAAVGLLVLSWGFLLRGGPDTGSARLFDAIAPHFPIFFVPAAVGVIVNRDRIVQEWLCVLSAVAIGTGVTLMVTGLTAQRLFRSWKSDAA